MRRMLFTSPFVLFAFLFFLPQAHAFSSADAVPNDAALAQMDQKAQQADARERCFLYAELAHFYTIVAGRQIAQGDLDQAALTLKHVEHYGQMVHAGLSGNVKHLKHLKDAEMLMHETTYHLGEYLHMVSSDEKAEIVAALKQLDQVNDEMLAQVFAH